MDPLELPLSVVLALWAPLPSSRGPALVQGPDGAHEVRTDADREGVGLQEWLDSARPLRRVVAALASSADGVLARDRAAQAGQAVVMEGAAGAHLLVPEETGTNVIWHVEPPRPDRHRVGAHLARSCCRAPHSPCHSAQPIQSWASCTYPIGACPSFADPHRLPAYGASCPGNTGYAHDRVRY